jgi:hypothetical protein
VLFVVCDYESQVRSAAPTDGYRSRAGSGGSACGAGSASVAEDRSPIVRRVVSGSHLRAITTGDGTASGNASPQVAGTRAATSSRAGPPTASPLVALTLADDRGGDVCEFSSLDSTMPHSLEPSPHSCGPALDHLPLDDADEEPDANESSLHETVHLLDPTSLHDDECVGSRCRCRSESVAHRVRRVSAIFARVLRGVTSACHTHAVHPTLRVAHCGSFTVHTPSFYTLHRVMLRWAVVRTCAVFLLCLNAA